MSQDVSPSGAAAGTEQAKSPLIVDLDGTLLCSDTLMEGVAAGLFQKPFSTFGRLCAAPLSRPKFKSWVFENTYVEYDVIPQNDRLVEFLQAEHAAGRAIHLVSAADQKVVERVAGRFGIFTSAHGSSGNLNLKGSRKLEFIQKTFGESFTYVGDSRPDMKIWDKSTGAIYAGANSGIARTLSGRGFGEHEDFSRTSGGLRAWLKAFRVHQWAKNLLLFMPLVLAHQYKNLDAVISVVLAFICMGVMASGTYLINDLGDLPADRVHRTKKSRPLAAVRIPIASGMMVAVLMVAGGLVGGYLLNVQFGLVLTLYLVTTLSYSLVLKEKSILDIFILAGLFTLRIIMGTVVLGLEYSQWLLTFSMFFFFSLSLAKRHVEVSDPEATPGHQVKGRGYYPEDAPLTLAMGIATGAASILILVLYLVDEAYGVDVYKTPAFLAGIPIVVGMWTARIWLLAHRRRLYDDPVSFAVKDWKSIVMGIALAAAIAAALLIKLPAV